MQGDFEKWFATQGEGEEPMPLPSQAAPGGGGGSSRGTPLPSPQRQAAGAQQQQGQPPIVSERMMGPPPLTGNEEVEQHVKSAVLAAPQLHAWPPGRTLAAPGCAAHSERAAQPLTTQTGGCSAAVRPGHTRSDVVADVITQVDQEIMAFYKAREKLVHDRMARAQ